MKTLFLSLFAFSIAMIFLGMQNLAYAPCLIGVTDCGPPPGVTVSTWTDSGFYEKNDTINYSGRVYVENYSNPIKVNIFNYSNAKIASFEAPVTNNTFNVKIKANFDTSGTYKIVACVNAWCDNTYFKFTAEPYKLSVNGQDFFLRYKSSADLEKIEADVANNALRVHVTGATSTGQQFVIDIPRALLDSKFGSTDTNFTVLIGMHQPDKYMQTASFKEISRNNISRTLEIDIPYEPVANSNGVWDFKIMPADMSSGPGFHIQSPLKQFKSGIQISKIQCAQDLTLVIKAEEKTPACIKQESISKLILRGWISTTSSLDQNNTIFGNFYQGIENDSGIVSVKNHTYYMMTATNTTYPIASGMVVKFNQVTFSFPYGAQATPGGVIIPFDMTFSDGTTESYGKVTKNPDGSGSLSGIGLGPGPSSNRTVTVQSIHTHPQAGVTMTEDKIKLLVSTDINSPAQQTTSSNSSSSGPAYKVGPDLLGPIPHQLVFFMKSNLTAKIFVEYTSNEPNTGTIPSYSSVYVGNGNFTPLNTTDVTISADPPSIPLTQGSNTTVVYTVTAKGVKGVYWISLVQFCGVMPLAIDINSLTISPFDIPVQTGMMSCPAQFLNGKILGISGGTAEYKIGQPVK